jgi:hypothetical protein
MDQIKRNMRKLALSMTVALLAAVNTFAQVNLPQASPKASVSYVIGLTEVTVNYGSPAVKGREIWGKLVPYGQVWRAGANEATTVSFSTDVNMEGQKLRAGKYALFFIPGETEWTVIFNRKTDQWGAYAYDENEDEIRFTVEPKMNEGLQERLTYSIHDMKTDMGYIKLSWDRMRLYMRFKVDVMEQAMANIIDALAKGPQDKQWMVYAQGADFLMQYDGDREQALDWARKSTDLESHAWNWHIRAKAEARHEDYVDALASSIKSLKTGMADPDDMYFNAAADQIVGEAADYVEPAVAASAGERQWIIYAQGAECMLYGTAMNDKALAWAAKSTELRDHPWNWYLRAQAEARSGDLASAVTSAKRSAELGAADPADVFYRDNKATIEAAITQWEAKQHE